MPVNVIRKTLKPRRLTEYHIHTAHITLTCFYLIRTRAVILAVPVIRFNLSDFITVKSYAGYSWVILYRNSQAVSNRLAHRVFPGLVPECRVSLSNRSPSEADEHRPGQCLPQNLRVCP